MKKLISIVVILMFFVVSTGCTAHMHTVGDGAKGNTQVEAKQWYILFGLIPLNSVDTKALSDGATDYEIKTVSAPIDIVISMFTGIVSVHSRSVIVKK